MITIIVSSFVLGFGIFLCLLYFYKDKTSHPLFTLGTVLIIFSIVIGHSLIGLSTSASYKDYPIEKVEYCKFSSCVSIFTNEKVWSYNDVYLHNNFSEKSKVMLRKKVSFYGNEVGKCLIIDDKEYKESNKN